MASTSDDDNLVILVCTNPPDDRLLHQHGLPHELEDAILLTPDDLTTWEPSNRLRGRSFRIKAVRRRLIEESSYFRGLLGGSFSESCQELITIEWDMESFISVLKYVYGFPLDISSKTLLPLLEGSLYFGVGKLLEKCEKWCSVVCSSTRTGLDQIQLDDLILMWNFCSQHALHFLEEIFLSFLARNFMWASSSLYFVDISYALLVSCVKHPCLTIDSEMHLAEALLVWIDYNQSQVESAVGSEYDFTDVLKHIRVCLLPLSFAAGKSRFGRFSSFGDKCIQSILRLMDHYSQLPYTFENGDCSHLRLRLTEYSEVLDLSGCPQMTSEILLSSILPHSCSMDALIRDSSKERLSKHEGVQHERSLFSRSVMPLLCFEAVMQVDISKCMALNIADAMEAFSQSFPSLRILRAAYLLNFKPMYLVRLLEKFPLLSEVDLTYDISPMAQVPDLYLHPDIDSAAPNNLNNFRYGYLDTTSARHRRLSASTIARLTLEGRSDVQDSDLLCVTKSCASLCYLNIKGCISLTDDAISNLLKRCTNLHSLMVSYTKFGNKSVGTLCSGGPEMVGSLPYPVYGEKSSDSLACSIQKLHMSGCMGVDRTFLQHLMSCMKSVKSLCLRDTQLDNHALSTFPGSSLEFLDVTSTMISQSYLACIIHNNPGLKTLKARDCKNSVQADSNWDRRLIPPSSACEQMYAALGNTCKLKEIAIGWGFSNVTLEALKPAITALSSLTVGLGGSLGEDALRELPTICPMLESLTLYFQDLSDVIILPIMVSLRHLKVLELCFCFGDMTISSFKFTMPHLRKLKLQGVASWMTHDDLLVLAQTFPSLIELCLVGCRRLTSDAQKIISHSWPGLINLHIEGCGELTKDGVSSLFNCVALEVLLLRHNGPGIQKSFILEAVSGLPMLRQLSLDVCDASEGSFDIPKFEDRQSLAAIKISRCDSEISSLDIQFVRPRRRPVHRDTLLLLRNGRNLVSKVVKERL